MSLVAILFGLASALSWGAGDFAGGLTSKRSSPYAVVIWADGVGMVVVGLMAFLSRDSLPSQTSLFYILLSSFAGAIGLVMLYRALADGQMSIAAPVSALMAAIVPVLIGVLLHGWPGWMSMAGVMLALVAIWLVTWTEQRGSARLRRNLPMPFLAGLLFGLFFIFMHQAADESVLWPTVLLRASSIALLWVLARFRRSSLAIPRDRWWLVALVGVCDIAGNIFYLLSARLGRMDLAAVLASLYPGVTVLLAWWILKERISFFQWVGVAAALGAIAMISQ